MSLTDEHLMAAYVDGEERAFERLYRRYQGRLRRMLQARLFDRDVAQDLVQQTFLHLHRARRTWRTGAPFRPWLFAIARNVRREYLRRVCRRREYLVEREGRDGSGFRAPKERLVFRITPEDQLCRCEDVCAVHAALAHIPPGQRDVIERHWLDGRPFRDVAEDVGTSLSAVKVRAHRGYERLRAALARPDVSRGAPSPDISQGPPGDIRAIPGGVRRSR